MTRNIVVYISGHGFGHLAQIAPVLNALHRDNPDISFIIRSELPESLISRRLRMPFTRLDGPVDVGVVQKNAVCEDIPATIKAARAFYRDFPARIEAETARLRPLHVHLVLSDISPLAFPVAQQLGVPSIAVASLDWHAIYRDFLPTGDSILEILREAHAAADLLIQPPLSMPMPSFPKRKSVPLIVDELPDFPQSPHANKKTALVMFGGAGDPPFDLQSLSAINDWRFLMLAPPPDGAPENVRQADLSQTTTMQLMNQCDVVVTKPGYGTLAECWRTQTPLCYLPRRDFAEYPYLDDWLQRHAPCTRMVLQDFAAGNWLAAMQEALACPRRWPDIPASGAQQAADLIAAECLTA